jgi:cysteine desulfurase/selenocysteine lyase
MKCFSDFPLLKRKVHGKPLIYFDSAATSHKPFSVIEAIHTFYTEEYATVHRSVYATAQGATERYNAVREKVRAFLNAGSTCEIVFTSGTTEAINLVARSFGGAFLKPQDEVLISEMEHHSNIVPWQMICAEKGAILKVIPINDKGELILEAFEQLLTESTKIVSIAHIANATGTENPIRKIIKLAHSKGAKVMIDGAQAAPHMPVDVQELDVDFYAFSGHKAFGPTGIGVLYGKKQWLEAMPPYQGGGDMIKEVTFAKTTYQNPPLKFEAGTPKIAEVIGLGAAIDYIEALGRDKIVVWEQQLLKHATEELEKIEGLTIVGTAAKKGPIISFMIEGIHPLDLGSFLDLQGIALRTGHLCAQPALRHFGVTSLARISFAAYNTLEEIDQFILALNQVRAFLR